MRRFLLADPPGPGPVWLRPLGGAEERAGGGAGAAAAIALLDALLAAQPGAVLGPGEAARLSTGDRDRLLAAVWEAEFGARVEATLRCSGCGAPFDLDFQLPELCAAQRQAPPAGLERLAGGDFALGATRFRLPTGADELAVAALGPEQAASALTARCVAAGDPAVAEAAMAALSPVLDIDLEAACPECGTAQTVPFSIEQLVLTRLAAARAALWREAHLLAATYRWALPDILALARAERRALVRLIEAEREALP